MDDTSRPRVYKPTDSQLVERFSREVAERLGDSLQNAEARASFTRNLSTLLNLAARIKARHRSSQYQDAAVPARKEES